MSRVESSESKLSATTRTRARTTRRDIQGLRAVAVGLVVADHADIGWLGGGFVGVDVFFVLSGFLITQLLVRELHRSDRVSVAAFYARRARRILPAACLVLGVVAIYAAYQLLVTRAADIGVDVLWAALFLANVHFAAVETDYFAAGTPASPVQHFWSLAVEEQFYLVWPAALALLAWSIRRHRGSTTGSATYVVRQATLLVAVIWVLSLAWSVIDTATDPAAAYFSTPARAWELATGALLALAGPAVLRIPVRWRPVLTFAGLGAIAVAALAFDPKTPFPGWAALLPVLGTAAVLAAGAERDDVGAARWLGWRPVTWIGDISYSLYLWHWPVLLLGRSHVAGWPPWAASVALVAISVALAALSYYVVETPFRRRRFWTPTWRGLLLWPVAVGLAFGSVQVAGWHEHDTLQARADAAASFDADSVPEALRTVRTGEQIHDELAESLDRAAVAAPVPFPLAQDLTELGNDHAVTAPGCAADPAESSHDVCPEGEEGADARVVLFGDSHAQMWLPALAALGKRDGFEVDPLLKWGCSPLAILQYDERGGSEFTACEDFRTWALGQISQLHPDLVIVSSRAYPPDLLLSEHFDPAEWQQAATETMRNVAALGFPTVLMGDVSHLEHQPTRCLAKPDATMAACTSAADPRVLSTNGAFVRAAAAAGTGYVDVNGLACLDNRCPMVADHIAVYRDKQHLSVTWVLHVADAFGRLFALP